MDIPTHAVKAVIELDGKILLLQRNLKTRGEDNWDLPGGLVEGDKSEEDALLREVNEELGLDIEIQRPLSVWNFMRKKDGKHVSVQNYLCRIVGDAGIIKLSTEHSAYKWIDPANIVKYPLKDQSLAISISSDFAK